MANSFIRMSKSTRFLLMMSLNLGLLAQPAEKPSILQVDKKIVIDGKLEDWAGIQQWPVNQAIDGTRPEPSADLAVMARFAFDAAYFYTAVEVKDDSLNFLQRNVPSSDAFYLVLVEPSEKNESASFIVFGFTLRDNEPFKVVVNRDGEPFPSAFTKDIQLEIAFGSDRKSFVAEVAVPWTHIPHFRPFIQPEWGVNLQYTDVDPGKRKSVQLVADPNAEKDVAKRSRGMVFNFLPRLPEVPEFQSLLEANHFYLEDERKIKLAVQSPKAQQGWRLTTALSSAQGTFLSRREFAFDEGLTLLDFPIEIEKPATGRYDLSLGVLDDKGILKFTEDKQFFLVDKKEFDSLTAKLEEIKKGETFDKDEVFRESLPTLEIRLQWIQEFMANAPPFASLDRVEQWDRERKELLKSVEEGKPALFPNGQVVRLAYRSPADGALRPYSAFVPPWYDPKTPLPLLVSLSGGPSAEQALGAVIGAHYGTSAKNRAGDFIFVAPEPENRSGWYTGVAGQEVLDCINHIKKLYKINEKSIILDGSGRGAYGALRLAFLNPDLFRGVITRMGMFFPPPDVGAENLLDLAGGVRAQNILIVLGQTEQPRRPAEIVSKEETSRPEDGREFAAKLRMLGMNVRLIEAKAPRGRLEFGRPESGPGSPMDFGALSVWEDIASWLRELLGDSAVFTKPPKKQPEKEPAKK